MNKEIHIFDGQLKLLVSVDDWDFMCEKRFGTINPSPADWQTEFVTGTGITFENKDLWDKASNRFADYIADLKELQAVDINSMARALIKESEKEYACI